MTDTERNLMVRTAIVVGQMVSMGSVEPDKLALFTEALHEMEKELISNNESHMLKPVLDKTKQ